MKTRILKALFIILLLAAIPIAAGAATIESVAVTVTEPTAGQVPPFTATYGEGYGAYTGSVLGNGYVGVIRWTDRTENAVLNQSSVFQAGHQYKVEIAL